MSMKSAGSEYDWDRSTSSLPAHDVRGCSSWNIEPQERRMNDAEHKISNYLAPMLISIAVLLWPLTSRGTTTSSIITLTLTIPYHAHCRRDSKFQLNSSQVSRTPQNPLTGPCRTTVKSLHVRCDGKEASVAA